MYPWTNVYPYPTPRPQPGMSKDEYVDALRIARHEADKEAKARRAPYWWLAGKLGNLALWLLVAIYAASWVADRTATLCLKDQAWCESITKIWGGP